MWLPIWASGLLSVVASFAMKISDGCNSREVHHVLRVKIGMEPLLLAIFVIALLVFLAWLCWTFIPWLWAKYLSAGLLGGLAVYKLILLVLYLV